MISSRYIYVLASIIFGLSIAALSLNYMVFGFPGNNYFPENTPLFFVLLLLINFGFTLLFGIKSKPSVAVRELINFFAIMSLIALATNAIQLTPFPPIDNYILSIEAKVHINMISILNWTNQFPLFKRILIFIYDSLPFQMSILPLLVIATGKYNIAREYYFLLLCTVLIGFVFYYFFPTTAPASVIHSPLFTEAQVATGLKFSQIHQHIPPSTMDGGLIALPSFHVIWALLCVYLLKEWFYPAILLLAVNILLILSCVLLGWHYPVDVVGGILILGFSYYLLERCKSQHNKSI